MEKKPTEQIADVPTGPAWAPSVVVTEAAKLLSEAQRNANTEEDLAETRELILRVLNDEKMDTVWRELYKKTRDREDGYRQTEIYLHPARQSAFEKLTQDEAVARYFRVICGVARHIEPIVQGEVKKKIEALDKIVDALRELKTLAATTGLDAQSTQLGELADEWEAERPYPLPAKRGDPLVNQPWAISRVRADPDLRTFVVKIGVLTDRYFGSHLYTTVANATNVVFPAANVTAEQVRELLSGHRRS